MRTKTLKEAERVPIELDARKMCTRSELELIHLTLTVGQSLPEHANGFDVVFYVLAGAGELTLAGETTTVAKDTVVEVPAGVLRGWRNAGGEDLRVLVVKLLGR